MSTPNDEWSDPFEIDTSVAHAARRYNYFLGGVNALIQRENIRSKERFQFRDNAEFSRFFDGMELVPPGIRSISEWRNDDPPEKRTSPADTASYGAVARIS